jgi:hypothetical protein
MSHLGSLLSGVAPNQAWGTRETSNRRGHFIATLMDTQELGGKRCGKGLHEEKAPFAKAWRPE